MVIMRSVRAARHAEPKQPIRRHRVATQRPDLRIGNLLDDPRLRLAVFGHDGQRDETAA